MLSLRKPFDSGGACDLTSGLRLREGVRSDYAALAEHHYRAGKPATATRVLVLESTADSLGDRYAKLNGRIIKSQRTPGLNCSAEVVAVLVESLPSLSCRMRDVALGHRYGSHLEPDERAVLLNEEVRCISRVVVAPRWRGLGLAGRLVREALETATTPVTEALAAMGRVHPFFKRAGMTAFPRPTHEFDVRLLEVFRLVGIGPDSLHDSQAVWSAIESLATGERALLKRELNAWYRKNAGRSANHERDPAKQLRAVGQRIGLEPVYYVKVRG